MASDLVVKFGAVEQQPTIFPDEQGKLKVIVTNQGDTEFSGPVDLKLYASTDKELDSDHLNTLGSSRGDRGVYDSLEGLDELLGSLDKQNIQLAPGQSQTFTVDFAGSEFRTPSVVSPGLYHLFAEVDSGNNITENKTNNVANQLITQGDVVIQWNSILLNAIQASGKGDALKGTPPPIAARNQAIVHAAIYDAVNAFDNSHKSYFVDIDPPQGASVQAAAVGAAYTSLVELFSDAQLYPDPQLRATLKATFDEQRDRSLREITDNSAAEQTGFDFGVRVAEEILAVRRNDGTNKAQQTPYTPGHDPGDYKPLSGQTPLLPGWGLVTPFAIPNVNQFRPEGPPEFSSPLYGRQIEEVRKLGAKFDTDVTKVARNANETEIAQFWAYDRDDTFRPPGQFNELAQEVALAQGNTLAENARLFALLNIAEADAGIVAWDAKYTYDQLRPITAIHNAGNDNNPLTIEDKHWEPLLNTPPFPDYVSGHSVFSGAATQILSRFFGDNISFDIPSQELPGVSRSFGSFTQAGQENAISRVYGGIHNELATVDGVQIGQEVGNHVFDNFLT
ncbi:MAG: phosphatase PAP2 family protein [Scytonema sp. PMC 1069.18]|nr:phosphatase PAP2 family protein [Scytonema sp. PMC 1069.18]MEC4885834.1 phosphatase PAP2 family protein [Scytonema sp. PMC 1070.18]